MRRLAFPLTAILIVGGFLVWWLSPTQVVKRRTKAVLEILSLDSGTSAPTRIQGTFRLERLLAKRLEISVPSVEDANDHFDKAEVSSAFQWLCHSSKETRLTLQGFDSVEIEGDKATVVASLDALVDMKSYRPVDGPGQATLVWRKSDEGWLLEKAAWKSSNL